MVCCSPVLGEPVVQPGFVVVVKAHQQHGVVLLRAALRRVVHPAGVEEKGRVSAADAHDHRPCAESGENGVLVAGKQSVVSAHEEPIFGSRHRAT